MPSDDCVPLPILCARSAGLTVLEVLSIARTGPLRYKVYNIPKRSGGLRVICQPSRELKALQYILLQEVLGSQPVHSAATAYKKGASIKNNAAAHASSRVILKLDFKDFFNSITLEMWRMYVSKNYTTWSDEDFWFSARVLFYGNRTIFPKFLSIGAPSSPKIANMLLFDFDSILHMYCRERCDNYTRYADDITISSSGYLVIDEIIDYISKVLERDFGGGLQLNNSKTKLFSRSAARRITGVTLSNSGGLSLGRERKRLISAMIHRDICGGILAEERQKLLGLLAFAKDVEPSKVARMLNKSGRIGVLSSIKGIG